MTIRGGRHQQLGKRGDPGVYILHFERPTTPPHTDGDEQHYVGQSHDTRNRCRQHLDTWHGRSQQAGASRVRKAGLESNRYRVVRVARIENEDERLRVEREWAKNPAALCSICTPGTHNS